MENQNNQQNKAVQRPSQDFQVGQKVRYFSEHTPIEGVEGTIVAINVPRIYPIKVQADTGEYTTFTLEGRSRSDGRVDLFGLEESDKQPESQDNTLLQTVNISIEDGTTIPYDGKVSIWQWNKTTYNQYFKANRPVWEFLTPEQVFYLCLFEVISLPKQVIEDNFTEDKSW